MIWYDVSFSPVCLIFSQLLNWEAISLHVQIEFYIVFKTENIDFMSRTSLFSEQRYVNNGMGYIYNIAIAIAMEVYDIHTPTDTGNTGNGGFTIYFILFDFQMELKCQLRLNQSVWAIAVCSMNIEQLQHVRSKCEMLFMFSSNVCLCGHFYSILRQ